MIKMNNKKYTIVVSTELEITEDEIDNEIFDIFHYHCSIKEIEQIIDNKNINDILYNIQKNLEDKIFEEIDVDEVISSAIRTSLLSEIKRHNIFF